MAKPDIRNAAMLFIVSSLLLLSSRIAGNVVISAQFTRGFLIGLGIMLDAVAVVWAVQATQNRGANAAQPATDDK